MLTSISNVARLEKESVINEVLNDLVKYRLSKTHQNTNNVQEVPEGMAFMGKLLKKC